MKNVTITLPSTFTNVELDKLHEVIDFYMSTSLAFASVEDVMFESGEFLDVDGLDAISAAIFLNSLRDALET
jgi:hypothetical protein